MSAEAASAAITRALELLGGASQGWRNGTAEVPGALHWAAAVNLARRELAEAQCIKPSGAQERGSRRLYPQSAVFQRRSLLQNACDIIMVICNPLFQKRHISGLKFASFVTAA